MRASDQSSHGLDRAESVASLSLLVSVVTSETMPLMLTGSPPCTLLGQEDMPCSQEMGECLQLLPGWHDTCPSTMFFFSYTARKEKHSLPYCHIARSYLLAVVYANVQLFRVC